MSGKYHNCWIIALLSGIMFCYGISPCCGESKEESFDAILFGYTKSLQKQKHVSFSYQSEEVVDGMLCDKSVGKIFFDQKNIRKTSTDTLAGDQQEFQYETVIAPQWDRYFRVGRDEERVPTVTSCLKSENIPPIRRTLGSTCLLSGRFDFPGEQEHVYLPEVLCSLGANNVTVTDSTQNRKELCFVYQDFQCRILLEVESFTLILFECNGLSEKMKNYSYSLEILDSQNINEIIFPTKFIATTQIPSSKVTYKYSLNNISFRPLSEEDFQFSMTLPNGTPVHMQDAPHIQYIWHDGKIVPKTDEVMLAIARGGHKFMPGPKEPRFWMMAIGITLILGSLAKMLYDFIKKNKKGEDE